MKRKDLKNECFTRLLNHLPYGCSNTRHADQTPSERPNKMGAVVFFDFILIGIGNIDTLHSLFLVSAHFYLGVNHDKE